MDTQDPCTASEQRPGRPGPGRLPPPSRHVRSYLTQGVTVVEIRGAVDISTAAEIRVHTDAASASRGARLIVDLRPVTFLDCATLGLLCRARRRALEYDGRMALVCVRPWHLRIFDILDLAELFEPRATVRDALPEDTRRVARRPR